jgi:hypothetical protein
VGELGWQVHIVPGTGIERMEADNRAIRSNHHKDGQVVSLGKPVGRALEGVIDVLDASGDVGPFQVRCGKATADVHFQIY